MKTLLTTLIALIIGFLEVSAQQTYYNVTAGNGYGLRFWSSDLYKIHMGNTSEYKYGPVTDYSIKMNMSTEAGRGWTWGKPGIAPVAALSNTGNMQIVGSFYAIGNIGIGLSDPEAKLHVYNSNYLGGTKGNSLLLTRLEGRTGNFFNISTWLLRDANGADWFTARYHNGISIDVSYLVPGVDTRTWWERDPYNNVQSWGHASSVYLTINNGNVGIGTTNPTEKLVVDGKIIAEEVKVQNVPASDYVFEPDYNLLSLQEVETFIKENKHLPDIPSAQEFKENGVGLGEMDNMLLRKVEELTLYVIQLSSQNEAIKDINRALSEEIYQLKIELKNISYER